MIIRPSLTVGSLSIHPPGSSTPPPPTRSGVGEPMFNFNGGARADLMAAVEELERHNEQERHIGLYLASQALAMYFSHR